MREEQGTGDENMVLSVFVNYANDDGCECL